MVRKQHPCVLCAGRLLLSGVKGRRWWVPTIGVPPPEGYLPVLSSVQYCTGISYWYNIPLLGAQQSTRHNRWLRLRNCLSTTHHPRRTLSCVNS